VDVDAGGVALWRNFVNAGIVNLRRGEEWSGNQIIKI
jgi:hypothetical protein